MADIVASSVVQEGVSRVSSYISGKLDEKASRGQIMAKLEMALSRLEFALERTAEWPTAYYYASLIRRRMMLKKAYKEGTDLLEKLKLQSESVEGGEEEIHQWVTAGSSFLRWISRARNLPILSLVGLSKEDISNSSVLVQKFEWYADYADRFVSDVESGCPLRHPAFGCPLERQLLEGKTLVYHVVKGSQEHNINMWPLCSEGRGIEVTLRYSYWDYSQRPAKYFLLSVTLRLSQGTSIVGTAVRCVQFVTESLKLSTSPFKCVMERAMGEVTLLSSLHDISHSDGPPFGLHQEFFVELNTQRRPDPMCCVNNVVSSELSHGVPEPVVNIAFRCFTSAPEYMLHSSTDEAAGPNASILRLHFCLRPHRSSVGPQGIVTWFEGKEERLNGSIMQHMEDLLRSRARDFLEAHHPEPAIYSVLWTSPHGAAFICLEKLRPVTACLKQRAVPRPHRRAAKRTKR